jgi:putative DNA primase/helicase
MERWCKAALQQIWLEVDEEQDQDRKKRLTKHAFKSETKYGILNALFLARSEPGIVIQRNELDQNQWYLNVKNGTIDLSPTDNAPIQSPYQPKLIPHNRNHLITKYCDVTYDPHTNYHNSLFYNFLTKVTDNDPTLMSYIQRAAGYSITGAILDHTLFFLYGTGRNGKSTFLNSIINVLGTGYARIAPRDLLAAKKYGDSHPVATSTLHGYRFVATIEGEGNAKLAESLVKQLTGGDRITTRRMRENYWEFDPTHKIWLAANHKPKIIGTDQGIWSRIRLIPFNVEIKQTERDRNLPQKLATTAEKQAILAWLVEGCTIWIEQGLNEPEIVKTSTEQYRQEQDILKEWIDERCDVGPDLSEKSADLFQCYREWCDETKERFPLSRRTFGIALKERRYIKSRLRDGIYWEGIRITVNNPLLLDNIPV